MNSSVGISPSEIPSPSLANEVCEPSSVALFLWDLLDDIDTASDIAKADDAAYRRIVERIQRRRFEVGSTDGYTVTLAKHPPHPSRSQTRPASDGEGEQSASALQPTEPIITAGRGET